MKMKVWALALALISNAAVTGVSAATTEWSLAWRRQALRARTTDTDDSDPDAAAMAAAGSVLTGHQDRSVSRQLRGRKPHGSLRAADQEEPQPSAGAKQDAGEPAGRKLATAKPTLATSRREPAAPVAREPAASAGRHRGNNWLDQHHATSGIAVFVFMLLLLSLWIPFLCHEKQRYNEIRKAEREGKTEVGDKVATQDDMDEFASYMRYRLSYWLSKHHTLLIGVILLSGTLLVCVIGALLYYMATGENLGDCLFRVFIWASASSMTYDEPTVFGRFVGVTGTIAGLVITALLLGVMAQWFAGIMEDIKMGKGKVIESGHVVILGFTDCTRVLVQELAMGLETSGGGTIVVLDPRPKPEVELLLRLGDIDLKGSQVIVRSGDLHDSHDLARAATPSALRVILLTDTDVSWEEADAKNLRVLLTLKSLGWPRQGHIVAQCGLKENWRLMKSMSDKVEVVVVDSIIAQLMAQSLRRDGIAQLYRMLIGFEGDEFYMCEHKELVGMQFLDVIMRFSGAVVVGVHQTQGGKTSTVLNPGWEYTIKDTDKIVVLAEDSESFKLEPRPYMEGALCKPDLQSIRSTWRGGELEFLIVGWNNKAMLLLYALSCMKVRGRVMIASSRSIPSRQSDLHEYSSLNATNLDDFFAIDHLEVSDSKLTSRYFLETLMTTGYDQIFVVADVESYGGQSMADEKTIAMLTKMQDIVLHLEGEESTFSPIVEVYDPMAATQLRLCKMTNFVEASVLTSEVLAQIAMERASNETISCLVSSKNELDRVKLSDILPEDADMPGAISFGEATAYVCSWAEAILIGWSVPARDADAHCLEVATEKPRTSVVSQKTTANMDSDDDEPRSPLLQRAIARRKSVEIGALPLKKVLRTVSFGDEDGEAVGHIATSPRTATLQRLSPCSAANQAIQRASVVSLEATDEVSDAEVSLEGTDEVSLEDHVVSSHLPARPHSKSAWIVIDESRHSEEDHDHDTARSWEFNPKDKVSRRVWSPDDRLLIMQRSSFEDRARQSPQPALKIPGRSRPTPLAVA